MSYSGQVEYEVTSLHHPLVKPWSLDIFAFISFLPKLKITVGCSVGHGL